MILFKCSPKNSSKDGMPVSEIALLAVLRCCFQAKASLPYNLDVFSTNNFAEGMS